MTADVLTCIEAYYDAVPRPATQPEHLPPFVLFVPQRGAWPYYARPQLGATRFSADDVSRVRARQRSLSLPESFEWVAENSPGLRKAAVDAGLTVDMLPLMVLGEPPLRQRLPDDMHVRLVTPDDDLVLLNAVADVGFGFPGTARGPIGPQHAAQVAVKGMAQEAFLRDRLVNGLTVMAVIHAGDVPVAVGGHQPVGEVTEVVGIATLPAYRRQGLAAALTGFLVEDALGRGVRTVFLSAGGEAVARVYGRCGFSHVGTACIGTAQASVAHGHDVPVG